MRKKVLTSLLLFFLVINLCGFVKAENNLLHLNSRAYVLMDPITGRILLEKNASEKRAMASTTKIMTAIVALENGDLSSTVKVSKKAAAVGGSSFHLQAGEEMSMESMLYGLLLPSGNDAAIALAEHVGGNVESFVEMMNMKALEIGALDTHFSNPHGLDDPNHYTTARDLALITRYALGIPKFREIVKTPEIEITEGNYKRQLRNTNRLLRSYEEVDGVKTGYTGQAGRCLVASASKDGFSLISVILDSQKHFSDSYELLNYGFSNYTLTRIVNKDSEYSKVPVFEGIKNEAELIAKDDLYIPIKTDEQIDFKIIAPDVINAPVVKNQELGEIHVFIDGNFVSKVPLVAAEDIRQKTFIDKFYNIIRNWLNHEKALTSAFFNKYVNIKQN